MITRREALQLVCRAGTHRYRDCRRTVPGQSYETLGRAGRHSRANTASGRTHETEVLHVRLRYHAPLPRGRGQVGRQARPGGLPRHAKGGYRGPLLRQTCSTTRRTACTAVSSADCRCSPAPTNSTPARAGQASTARLIPSTSRAMKIAASAWPPDGDRLRPLRRPLGPRLQRRPAAHRRTPLLNSAALKFYEKGRPPCRPRANRSKPKWPTSPAAAFWGIEHYFDEGPGVLASRQRLYARPRRASDV